MSLLVMRLVMPWVCMLIFTHMKAPGAQVSAPPTNPTGCIYTFLIWKPIGVTNPTVL